MTLVGDSFKAIETPLNLLLLKAAAIGTIIVASAGLGALALVAGIAAINATIIDMLTMTSLASKWKTSDLENGKTKNIVIAAEAFTAIEKPLNDLLEWWIRLVRT